MRISHFYFVLLIYAKVQTSDKLDKLEERNTHFQEEKKILITSAIFAQSQEISSYANNRLKCNKIKQKHDFNDSSLSEFRRQKFLYEFDELLLLIENT